MQKGLAAESHPSLLSTKKGGGGGRGRSVDRARDSWCGGRGFDPRCGHPLPTGWVGVNIM